MEKIYFNIEDAIHNAIQSYKDRPEEDKRKDWDYVQYYFGTPSYLFGAKSDVVDSNKEESITTYPTRQATSDTPLPLHTEEVVSDVTVNKGGYYLNNITETKITKIVDRTPLNSPGQYFRDQLSFLRASASGRTVQLDAVNVHYGAGEISFDIAQIVNNVNFPDFNCNSFYMESLVKWDLDQFYLQPTGSWTGNSITWYSEDKTSGETIEYTYPLADNTEAITKSWLISKNAEWANADGIWNVEITGNQESLERIGIITFVKPSDRVFTYEEKEYDKKEVIYTKEYLFSLYYFIRAVFHISKHEIENDEYIDELFRRFWLANPDAETRSREAFFMTYPTFEYWLENIDEVEIQHPETQSYMWYNDYRNQACRDRIIQLVTNIINSRDSWEPLIKIQQDNIDHLTDRLKTISQVKFNDTPQNNLNYSGDDYTSTITTNTSEVEIGTIADKLEVAKKALNDYYDRWLEEVNYKPLYLH